MAGAGQWAGPLPPAGLLLCHHGQPPAVCAGRAGAAPAWDGSGAGSLFLREGGGQQPGVPGWSGGSPLQASSSVTAAPEGCPGGGSSSLGPVHRGSGDGLWGLCASTGRLLWAPPAPAPVHPRAEMPFDTPFVMPGVVWGPQGHVGGSEGHFSMHSSHGILSPGLLWAEESGHVWGLGEPSVSCPRPPPCPPPSLCHSGSQTQRPVPSLPAGGQCPPPGMTKGAQPEARMGTAPGVLELPLGMGGSWSPGVSPRGGSRAAPSSGSEESLFWQGLPQGLSHIPEPPALGAGGCCHVL